MQNKTYFLYKDYCNLYYGLTKKECPKLEQIIKEFVNVSNRQEADKFFSDFGVGNVVGGTDRPFERQKSYEILLNLLFEINPTKYKEIHKGTPYYFIAWITFQYHDYPKSFFYMDAATSEDLKQPDFKKNNLLPSSIAFFLLYNINHPYITIYEDLIKVIKTTLHKYSHNGGRNITIDEFGDSFCKELFDSGPDEKSLLSALYIFILQFHDFELQLNLKSSSDSSILPFLNHLFDGARILESLLGLKCKQGRLKDKILKCNDIKVSSDVLEGGKKLENALEKYYELKNSNREFQDYNFACAYIIRNTTGHTLLWNKKFSYSTYLIQYNSLINSIFWTIDKLWITKNPL